MVVDQLPRLGRRELVCLLLFTCNYVVSVWRGFLFLSMLGMGCVISLWHSLSLPYNYFSQGGSYDSYLNVGIMTNFALLCLLFSGTVEGSNRRRARLSNYWRPTL